MVGDLTEPLLGVSEEDRKALAGVEHFFHLAAIYDMTADETQNALLNVGGTQNAVQLANELGAGVFHHVSSVAVAGRYKGHFTEDMFDEGQELHTPYHRTKFEAEKLVRAKVQGAWRVYRPAVVVGNSKTGEMDKIDGPYYFFKVLQKLRNALPQWAPLVSIEWGWTNLVPVDYVAAAIDHIAHEEGYDGQAFHIVDPKGIRAGEAMNTFARAGHAPHAVMRIDKKMTDMLPKGVLSYAMQIPALKGVRKSVLADLGIPDEILQDVAFTAKFDARDTQRALAGTGIELPRAGLLRLQAVGLLGAQPRPGPVQGPLVRGRRQRPHRGHHGRLQRHRPRRRAQDRRRGRRPDPGRPLAATSSRRSSEEIECARRHRLRLLGRPLRQRLDRRRRREDPLRPRRRRHARQQRGPLDPALRDALDRPLPRLRADGQAQLPRHDQADPRRCCRT